MAMEVGNVDLCLFVKKRSKFLNETNTYGYFVRLDYSSTANIAQIFLRNEISIGWWLILATYEVKNI